MIIRGKVKNDARPGELIEVEFEIPDDSPEAQAVRASALGSYSIAPTPAELCTQKPSHADHIDALAAAGDCLSLTSVRRMQDIARKWCESNGFAVTPASKPRQPWKSGGGAGQWNG